MGDPDSRKALEKKLREYGGVQLLNELASLQLMPTNGGFVSQLESATAFVAGLTLNELGPRMTRHRMTAFLHGPQLRDCVQWNQDPFPNLFVAELTRPQGTFLVLPGDETNVLYIVSLVAEALDSIAARTESAARAVESSHLLLAALTLSNEVCCRAHLTRGMTVNPSLTDIQVPSSAERDALSHATRFTLAEIEGLARSVGAPPTVLAPLTATGNLPWNGRADTNPLAEKPLVRRGDEVLVAAPSCILGAVRTHIVRSLDDPNFRREFVSAFQQVAVRGIERSLETLGMRALQKPTSAGSPTNIATQSHLFYRSDSNRAVHVVVLTDALENWDPAEVMKRPWECALLSDLLERQLNEVDHHLRTQAMALDEWSHVIALQGLGRFSSIGLGHAQKDTCSTVLLSGAALEAIGRLEAGQSQHLHQFARASDSWRNRTSVLAFGPLDEYAIFRRHSSFYLSDELPATGAFIGEEQTAGVLHEVQSKFDPHGALVPWTERFREVERIQNQGFPLYRFSQNRGAEIEYLLEDLALPVWIRAYPVVEAGLSQDLPSLMAQTVAFWLWDCRAAIRPTMEYLRARMSTLVLDIVIESPGSWFKSEESAGDVAVQTLPHGLRLTLPPTVSMRFAAEDNRGERSLLRTLLHGLYRLSTEADGGTKAPPLDVNLLVAQRAPLGMKRQFVAMQANRSPSLNDAFLPAFRPVQPAEQERVLDELGPALLVKGVFKGPEVQQNSDDRVRTLNEAVRILFAKLTSELARFDAKDTLSILIAQNEAVIHEDRRLAVQSVTHSACFGETANEQLRKRLPEIGAAGVAGRFLVELAAAHPPAGTRSLGLGDFDRLLAIAKVLIDLGWISDLIHYRLADVGVSFLASGRLGLRRGDLEAAIARFSSRYHDEEINRNIGSFAKHWGAAPPSDPPHTEASIGDVDDAAEAEFGYSMTFLGELVGDLARLGFEMEGSATMAEVDLVTTLERSLSRSPALVRAALRTLTLAPRSDFLKVDSPNSRPDVFPWRFNRALSYLRRPLVMRQVAGVDRVSWGPRHVIAAGDNLFSLCLTGRLKARSKEMQQFMGSVQAAAAKRFNQRVAELWRAAGYRHVWLQVDKFGKVRLQEAGEDLGDVDVLVADTDRRTLLAVETKDLELARTPAELANEISNTFRVGGDGRSAMEKHERRRAWVERNLSIVLHSLGLGTIAPTGWRVQAMFVVSRELMGPYLTAVLTKVVSYQTLKTQLAGRR